MIYFINAHRTGEPDLIIQVRSDLPAENLINSIKNAVADFVNSDSSEARNAMQATQNQFNWGDLDLWLPARHARDHSFEIIGAAIADMTVDHDESLLPE